MESGVPFGWVAGDEVYGNDRNLRLWLERRCVPHVLTIKRIEKLWALTVTGGRSQVRADRLASGVEECAWVRRSAGDGAKGPRVYDWAVVDIRPLRESGQGYWLLTRHSLSNPGGTGLLRLLQPSGNVPEGTGEGGRDPVGHRGMLRGGQGTGGAGPVRGAEVGWLVPAHHSVDAGPRVSVRNQASGDGKGRKAGYYGPDEELIPMTVPEVLRLLTQQ